MSWTLLAALAISGEGDGSMIPKFVPRISIYGWQYWSDVAVAKGCRIQRHAVYDGYRVLDADDRCVAAGSRELCDRELSRRLQLKMAEPYRGEVVLLMHGVLRSSRSMVKLAERLESQGFAVAKLDYASSCMPIARHAENMRLVVDGLKEASAIHVVGHSMGGLVTRRYLAGSPDARVKRVVLMGTPNQGSQIADLVNELRLFHFIFGPAGKELCTGRDGEACRLPEGVEAAVVAGGIGKKSGLNPFFKADNDGIVTVDSAKLPGASDFLMVPAFHGRLVHNVEAADAVGRFLRSGKLRPGDRVPN